MTIAALILCGAVSIYSIVQIWRHRDEGNGLEDRRPGVRSWWF